MYRATSRLTYNQPWRSAALAVGAASAATVAYNVAPPRAKLLADSSNNASAADWSTKPTIIAPLASRTDGTGKQRTEQADPNPPSQRKDHGATDPEADPAVAQTSSDIPAVTSLWESFAHFDFKNITENLTKMVVPAWVLAIPDAMHKLQDELSMAPWSLSWEIWEHAHDPEVNPEIVWDANVRISNDLCAEEVQYLEKRKVQTAKALARYLDVPESEVHPDDVPVIAMCGSGGGLRALVAGTSSYFSAQQAGLFDCATYTAGVSGSCWLQTLYYSSIGQTSHGRLIDHFKDRLGVHIAFPPAALSLLSQAPTNKFLLSGIVEKLKGVPDADFGLVDIYGTLLAGRLLVPKGELRVSDWDLKISNQRYFVDMGDQPLPIYAAVRHEIPERKDDGREALPGTRQQPKKSDYFQWFEWTPYEFFCEELSAGIPTWAVGRQWDRGQNVLRENGLFLPEIKVPLMMGIWGSAFCATLSHYYKEIRPVIVGSGVGGGLDQLLTQKDEDMTKVHPFDPASIPNFALGLRGQLPPTCPESIHTASHLRLMDAGMSNNLPIYPLLRPGRDIDIIVAFDASADAASDNWLKVAEGYARQRKIKGWPMGAGWPPRNETTQEIAKEIDQAQEKAQKPASEVPEIKSPVSPASASSPSSPTGELGHCNIWVGCKTETTPTDPDFTPPIRKPLDLSTATTHTNSKTTDKTSPSDHDTLLSPTAGLTLIYFPLTSNPQIPGVDPAKSDFLSTWNFVYTPEEIESVVALAKANFEEGAEQTRRTVRAVWMRKREARLEEERKAREMRRRLRLRRGEGVGGVKGGGEGDHFS